MTLKDSTTIGQMCKYFVAIWFIAACASMPVERPQPALVPQVPLATQEEVHEFSSRNEVVRTTQGVEVRIAYESDIRYDILRDPGLTFRLEGFPDHHTSGQGRFYVFGRYVSVERVWVNRINEPTLKLVFEPSSPEMPRVAWEDAVNLVVERVKKQGIGFNGYSAAVNKDSDLIALYFELPEEALFLEAHIIVFAT